MFFSNISITSQSAKPIIFLTSLLFVKMDRNKSFAKFWGNPIAAIGFPFLLPIIEFGR